MIKLSSSAANAKIVLGASASDSLTVTQPVSSLADDLWALVAVYFQTGVSQAGATISATVNGDAMSSVGSAHWTSSHNYLKVFSLADPDVGNSIDTVVSIASAGTEVPVRNLVVVSAIYSGVESIGTATVVSGDDAGSSSNNNVAVTDSTLVAAGRIFSAHAVTGIDAFISNNKVKNGGKHSLGLAGGDLLVQSCPGTTAATTMTAVQPIPTAAWGAILIPMAPAIVMVDMALTMGGIGFNANPGIFRVAEPNPDRLYEIPSLPTLAP